MRLQAFSGCVRLTGALELPAGVQSVGAHAFDGCRGLSGLLVLPPALKSIGVQAFAGCRGLTGELRFPATVASVGEMAFEGCRGLSSLQYVEKQAPTSWQCFLESDPYARNLRSHASQSRSVGLAQVPTAHPGTHM